MQINRLGNQVSKGGTRLGGGDYTTKKTENRTSFSITAPPAHWLATTAQLAGPASLVTPDTTAQKLCRGCRCVHFYIIILSETLKIQLKLYIKWIL